MPLSQQWSKETSLNMLTLNRVRVSTYIPKFSVPSESAPVEEEVREPRIRSLGDVPLDEFCGADAYLDADESPFYGCCCPKHKQFDYQVDSPCGETYWFEFHKLISQSEDCSQEDGQSVSSYLLKMKSYLDILERLGYVMPNELGVSLILNSFNKDYDQFIQNYNMHNMGKTIDELHAMLKLHEKGIPKKAETPTILAIREPKISPSPKRDNLVKDSVYHHYHEVGNWRRNCPSYHAELKKRKNASIASTSVGNGMREAVEAIGSSDLVLPSGLIIVLDNCHVAPTITKGVDLISHLVNNEDDAQPYENTSKIHDEVMLTEVEPQNVKIPIRKSARIPQAPYRYGFYVDVKEYELGDLNEPPNYKAALSDPESDKWLKAMNTEIQTMKDNQDLGEAAYILGIKIIRDRSKRLISLKSAYLEKILKKFRMENSKRGNTKDIVLVYGAKSETELKVSCYADASFQTDKDDTKSQIGYVFVLNGGAVDWKSAKQSTTAMYFTEAEYIDAAEASMEAVWMRKFINGLRGVVPSNKRPI
ncbi:hypothetical protein Tco_0684230 [Tanacetum coccineum]